MKPESQIEPFFEVNESLDAVRDLASRHPLAQEMSAVKRTVSEILSNIHSPAFIAHSFDCEEQLRRELTEVSKSLPLLLSGDIAELAAFLNALAAALAVALQINETRIRALLAGAIPDKEKFGETDWKAVLDGWRILFYLKEHINNRLIPRLTK